MPVNSVNCGGGSESEWAKFQVPFSLLSIELDEIIEISFFISLLMSSISSPGFTLIFVNITYFFVHRSIFVKYKSRAFDHCKIASMFTCTRFSVFSTGTTVLVIKFCSCHNWEGLPARLELELIVDGTRYTLVLYVVTVGLRSYKSTMNRYNITGSKYLSTQNNDKHIAICQSQDT